MCLTGSPRPSGRVSVARHHADLRGDRRHFGRRRHSVHRHRDLHLGGGPLRLAPGVPRARGIFPRGGADRAGGAILCAQRGRASGRQARRGRTTSARGGSAKNAPPIWADPALLAEASPNAAADRAQGRRRSASSIAGCCWRWSARQRSAGRCCGKRTTRRRMICRPPSSSRPSSQQTVLYRSMQVLMTSSPGRFHQSSAEKISTSW